MSPSDSYSPMFVLIHFWYFLDVLVCHFNFKFRSVNLQGYRFNFLHVSIRLSKYMFFAEKGLFSFEAKR
jgi:hypothetical protein